MEEEVERNALTAERIRWARETRLGYSTVKLTEALKRKHGVKVEPSSVTRYEKWETYERVPPADFLRGLAALAETTTDYLMGLTDDPVIPQPSEDRRRLELVRGALEARKVNELVSRSPDGKLLLVELKESTAGAPETVVAAVVQAIRPRSTSPGDVESLELDRQALLRAAAAVEEGAG